MWMPEVSVERSFALAGLGHHVDAAAGRIHLFAPEHVGGAGGEAEAAVDAVGEEVFRRGMVCIEGAGVAGRAGEGCAAAVSGVLGMSDVSGEAAGVEGADGVELVFHGLHEGVWFCCAPGGVEWPRGVDGV